MNQELMDACEFAKFAADMTIPLEAKPTPEAGTEVVEGMVDESAFQPQSVGAQTYAGAADAAALAKAKEYAACAAQAPAAAEAQKTASAYEEGFSAGYDFAMEKVAGTAAKNAMNFVKNHMPGNKGVASKVMDAAKRVIPGRQSMASRAGAKITAGGAAALAALGIRNNSAAARVKRFLATNKGKAILAGGAGAAALGGAAAYRAHEKRASLEDAYLAGYQFALEKEAAALALPAPVIDAELVPNAGKAAKALEFLKGNKKAVAGGAAALGAAGLLAKKMLAKKTTAQKAMAFAKKHKVGLGAGAAAGALGGAYAASKN